MERDSLLVEMTIANAEPAYMEEQLLQSLTKVEPQSAVQNYNAQRQACFRNRPSTKQMLTWQF
jgi:hypothetical protein